MQVDGSFGTTAAITEMLIQSQDGSIRLLPALPDEWNDGQYKGVCARGGFELDYAWKDRQITHLVIKSKAGGLCRMEDKPNLKISSEGHRIEFNRTTGGSVEFNTDKGHIYIIE